MNDSVKSFEEAGAWLRHSIITFQCSKKLPIIPELRGPYQFAWVGDGVVRQWFHCPESLSCKAHRASLWTADINLRRQRSGGVWLSSHTTTHISTHRATQTPQSHMHIHYVTAEREDAVSSCLPHHEDLILLTQFTQYTQTACMSSLLQTRCRRKMSCNACEYKEGLVPLIQFSVWLLASDNISPLPHQHDMEWKWI